MLYSLPVQYGEFHESPSTEDEPASSLICEPRMQPKAEFTLCIIPSI